MNNYHFILTLFAHFILTLFAVNNTTIDNLITVVHLGLFIWEAGRDFYRRAFIWTFCRRDNEDLLVLDAILNLLYLRVTYCKKRNVSKNSNCPWQGGMKHLYGKNRLVEARIPARRDGRKNVPPPYKQYANYRNIYMSPVYRPIPVNVPSRLSYKQALRFWLWFTKGRCNNSHPSQFINVLLSKFPYMVSLDDFFNVNKGKLTCNSPFGNVDREKVDQDDIFYLNDYTIFLPRITQIEYLGLVCFKK